MKKHNGLMFLVVIFTMGMGSAVSEQALAKESLKPSSPKVNAQAEAVRLSALLAAIKGVSPPTADGTNRCYNFQTQTSYMCCDNGQCGSIGSRFVEDGGATCKEGPCRSDSTR
jgi:hypothetical protein